MHTIHSVGLQLPSKFRGFARVSERSATSSDLRRLLVAILEIALIFATFAYEGGWPPPDPNEPHYLCKARHYWQPNWCPRDFFLNSHDTHLVFYTTVGALAHVCSLPMAAWIGRLLTFAAMAVGWRRLNFTMLPRPGWSVLSACLFAAINCRGRGAGGGGGGGGGAGGGAGARRGGG